MALTLYYHPLASFCWKVLIPLYENATPFTGHVVDLMDEASAAALKRLWPIGKFPVLHDEAPGRTVAESTTIIEYLDLHYPGPTRLIPPEPDLARGTRFHDRFYDLYVHEPMQKIVTDRLRPVGRNDPHGVEAARGLEQLEGGVEGHPGLALGVDVEPPVVDVGDVGLDPDARHAHGGDAAARDHGLVRHARALGGGQFRGADVHAPVQLHRVGVDHLTTEFVGESDAQRRLAGRRRTDDGDHAALCPIRHRPTVGHRCVTVVGGSFPLTGLDL